jgi:hypothetical protein
MAKRFHEHRNPLFLAPSPNARQHTPKNLGKSGGDPIGGSENLHRSFPPRFWRAQPVRNAAATQ